MAYTETTTTGYGSRIGGAFKGILGGIVLVIGGTIGLFWNEGRTVSTSDAINEANKNTVELADITKIDSSFNGKLVHAVGKADTQERVQDPIFGANSVAIKISRDAQYYQWIEHSHSEKQKKMGGSEETVTTYTYTEEWVNEPVDSGKFKDPAYRGKNRVLADVKDEEFYASNVSFGAYRLPDFLKSSVGGAIPLAVQLSPESRQRITARMKEQAMISSQENIVYLGRNPNMAANGDVRITFTQVPPAEVSIIAKVQNNTFEQYVASNGNTFSSLSMGNKSKDAMIADAKSANKLMAWMIRLAGTVAVVMGFGMILKPIEVLADVVPFLGNLVGMGTGLIAGIIGTAWSLLVIAFAWFFYRPLLSIFLLALAGGAVALIVYLVKKRNATA